MSDERKEPLEPSNPEFRIDFNTDEGYREVRGVNMTTMGPGPGKQRVIMGGEFGGVKTRMRGEVATPEQTFRSTAIKYLEGAYRSMETKQRQTVVDQALTVPNYQNLFMKILVAAIYFRQLTTIRNRDDLTAKVFEEYASIVLAPLLTDKDVGKNRKKNTKETYQTQIKADLLRYLRYLLPIKKQ